MPSPVSVKCPHCMQILQLKTRASLGRKVACPECRRPFVLREMVDEELFEEAFEEYGDDEGYDEPPRRSRPPRSGRDNRKRTKSRSRARRGGPDANQLAIAMGVLCIIHSCGNYWGYRSLPQVWFGLLPATSSLLGLAEVVALTAFLVGGIGILSRADWSVQVANVSAIALLVLIALSTLDGLLMLRGGVGLPFGLPFGGAVGRFIVEQLLVSIVKQAAIPGAVLWWTFQNPRL